MRRSASQIIRNLESRITQLEKTASKFPPKAVDLNKVTDSEGFWNMSLGDLKAINPVLSTRGLQKPNAKMSDIIFFLNMASGAWENTQKGRKVAGHIILAGNVNVRQIRRDLEDTFGIEDIDFEDGVITFLMSSMDNKKVEKQVNSLAQKHDVKFEKGEFTDGLGMIYTKNASRRNRY